MNGRNSLACPTMRNHNAEAFFALVERFELFPRSVA
jgi:hypothetical protein